ncbi:pyrimidine dimer DNA glycosylase/endonuclease V [Sinomicrobium kalidii]|uniref:pyrimidine dimer DNA glycosylase/endonuclease V n=1 Tax=Sinomicrobium kalidii TaxID=2900738 RepID=UPI001E4D7E80|nr:pyrimidine dimer DNA glycosylase/endonuclease V [Sinomicrobium kalidii]UGU16887.1 pyrimidine dimer DNA glycosylase/endonuclease V [Sinomicrobium kalidii]
MRIWSLHPKYLDTKGLVALWRETLLAKHVLEGKTRGYKNHPQLDRFKALKDPVHAVNQYLSEIFQEAFRRNYNFNREKIQWDFSPITMKVTSGQIAYETGHLLDKLKIRDIKKYHVLKAITSLPDPHPMFEITNGDIEDWEVL